MGQLVTREERDRRRQLFIDRDMVKYDWTRFTMRYEFDATLDHWVPTCEPIPESLVR